MYQSIVLAISITAGPQGQTHNSNLVSVRREVARLVLRKDRFMQDIPMSERHIISAVWSSVKVSLALPGWSSHWLLDFKGKIVAITGGASGIGAALPP